MTETHNPRSSAEHRRSHRLVKLVIAGLITSLVSVVAPATSAEAATLTVTLLTDTGGDTGTPGDLRWAISQANAGGGDTITFAATGTIHLTRMLPAVVKSTSIVGPGADQLTVSGEGVVRAIQVASPAAVALDGLRFASAFADYGGAILVNAGASLTVANSVFTANVATQGGGAIANFGTLVVRASEFTDNTSDGGTTIGGGGAILGRGAWTVENSTFAANRGTGGATAGGAISSCAGGVSQLVNSTVVGNSAADGGGVYSTCSATSIVHLQNSIVSGNSEPPSPLPGPDIAGNITADNSIIGQWSFSGPASGSNNIVGQPTLLGALGNYGAPTRTFPLLPGSSALGGGAIGVGIPTVDQRGIARTGRNDIGAFQSQGFTLTKTSGDNQAANPSIAFAPLVVTVASVGSGGAEPVVGGRIDFAAPATGASVVTPAESATISAGAQASIAPVANGAPGGPYGVTASAGASGGAGSSVFTLTNTRAQVDVSVVASNDAVSELRLGESLSWKFEIANVGQQVVSFPAGSRIFVDDLPGSATYGALVASNLVGLSGAGSVSCSLTAGTIVCTAAGGPVVMAPGGAGAFTLTLPVTPTNLDPHTNPRPSGICMVDPDDVVAEPNASVNNACLGTVTVVAPALKAFKYNSVSNKATPGFPFRWFIAVSSAGDLPFTFTDGQRMLVDDLPNDGVTYSAVTLTGGVNLSNVACAIVDFRLTCAASGGPVTFAEDGAAFTVGFTATPSRFGSFVNPRPGGTCAADPDALLLEANETDNNCANTVSMRQPDMTATLTTGQPATLPAGESFSWFMHVANEGDLPATFARSDRRSCSPIFRPNSVGTVPSCSPPRSKASPTPAGSPARSRSCQRTSNAECSAPPSRWRQAPASTCS